MSGWDRQINGDGDTVADALVARLDDIEERLGEIVELLHEIAKPSVNVISPFAQYETKSPVDPVIHT